MAGIPIKVTESQLEEAVEYFCTKFDMPTVPLATSVKFDLLL